MGIVCLESDSEVDDDFSIYDESDDLNDFLEVPFVGKDVEENP